MICIYCTQSDDLYGSQILLTLRNIFQVDMS
jgi:hypothetical protein